MGTKGTSAASAITSCQNNFRSLPCFICNVCPSSVFFITKQKNVQTKVWCCRTTLKTSAAAKPDKLVFCAVKRSRSYAWCHPYWKLDPISSRGPTFCTAATRNAHRESFQRKPASAATAADFRAVFGYTRPQEYTCYAHHNLNWPALHKCTSQLSN